MENPRGGTEAHNFLPSLYLAVLVRASMMWDARHLLVDTPWAFAFIDACHGRVSLCFPQGSSLEQLHCVLVQYVYLITLSKTSTLEEQ